jgi:1-deoxy-D-xylulose-5-phosphate reductoisomerase
MVSRICILGATGSIGCSALDVIARNTSLYSVEVLTANTSYQKLFEQCQQFKPRVAVMTCEKSAAKLVELIDKAELKVKVESGQQAVNEAAGKYDVDVVIAAIVGAAGLLPTLSGVKANRKILLANKEALVMSGDLFMSKVEFEGAILLPVDSEHNAIFQSLPTNQKNSTQRLSGVHEILLTGSGGPFIDTPLDSLVDKTPEQACAHPNWDMGRKISVDSATMMNKGLELIEACYLFNVEIEKVKIVLHPQSIIHSMVSYLDGSVIAQMGNPDMRTPIAHCLAWPERIDAGVKPLDFYAINGLDFRPPDFERYPCLKLAIYAAKQGQSAPCILNAANEIAVEAFLSEKIKFTQIAEVIETTLSNSTFESLNSIDQIVQTNAQARNIASTVVKKLSH